MWWHRGKALGDLAEDMRDHIDEETEVNIARGMSPDEARRQARIRFGNPVLAAEDTRAVWGWRWAEALRQDVQFSLRLMRRTPLFAVVAVLSLGIGIGANTAVFSIIDSVFLRPLPVADPGSLVVLKWQAHGYTQASTGMSWSTGGSFMGPDGGTVSSVFPRPALDVFASSDDVLVGAFGYFVEDQLGVTVGDRTESLRGQYVSGGYFNGIGVSPRAGRLIQPADDDPASAGVAVLSERFGTRSFGTPEAAVGQAIRINDKPFVVIGVVPEAFFGAEPASVPDVYVPLRADAILSPGSSTERRYVDPHYYWLDVMARLRPGVTADRAGDVLAARFRQFVEGVATTDAQRGDVPQLIVQDGSSGLDSLRRHYAGPVGALMAMVALMLLIACSNLAHLSLAHVSARRRELAVRLGIGASRGRIMRQLLTESVLLASVGGVCGVALGWWGIRVLTRLFAGGQTGFTLHAGIDWTVLAVTAGLSLVTGMLFGAVPALQATRVAIAPTLRDSTAGPGARRRRWPGFGQLLVATQVALSLLLLVAAGLFGRTLANLHAIDLGFNRDHVLLFTVRPRTVGYDGASLNRYFEDLRLRLGALGGVRSVSLSSRPLPMGGGTMAPIAMAGGQQLPENSPGHAAIVPVGPDFLDTMGISLLRGREFSEADREGTPKVVMVNRRVADAVGLADPVGHVLTFADEPYEVIGLADDALVFNLREDTTPALYLPYLQTGRPSGQMTYALRTDGDPLGLAAAVQETVRQVDSRVAIHDLATLGTYVDRAISTEIALARLSLILAVVALVVAGVGFYGTVAFAVARRTHELGIRIALGATRRRLVWGVLRDVLVLVGVGLAIGIPVALMVARYAESLLYGIEPRDPVAIALAVTTLVACGVLAAFVPARRASRIDPLTAIRCE